MNKWIFDALKNQSKALDYSNEPIRPFHSKIMAISRTIDSITIIASLWLATYLYGLTWHDSFTWVGIAGLFIFQYLAEYNEVYEIWRGFPISREAVRILGLWSMTVLILSLIAYFSGFVPDYPRTVIAIWFVITPALIILLHVFRRLLLLYFRNRNKNVRRVVVLGIRSIGKEVEQAIKSMPWLGYRFEGYYDDRAADVGRRLDDSNIRVLGGFDDLINNARAGKIDVVYVVLPMSAEKRIHELVNKLADSTVSVYVVPDFFMFGLLHARWSSLQGIPAVSVYETPFYGIDGLAKRIEDIVLGSLILSIIAIPMFIIAVGVKISSPGPIFFRQKRYGIHGEEMKVCKFRTMKVCEDREKVIQATRNDDRITAFGAFLRRTSLDELPQFVNVLQGKMSIVGPRPHAVAHNEEYRSQIQGYMLRHKVKPGITGWAQINGLRGETDTLDKMKLRVKYDLDYIRKWSLWIDLKIILLTIIKGFAGKNVF
jgi:putative colanic acid biosynthesis UDP-glucose lipid carrier transferase